MVRWPAATVVEAIQSVADNNPDATAIQTVERDVSYAELLTESTCVAVGLQARGVTAGDRIAVWLGNRPEWITVHLGAAYLGASVVAVNTRYRSHELAYMLDDAEVSVLVTESSFLGSDYLEMITDIVPAVTDVGDGVITSTEFPALDYVVTSEEPEMTGKWTAYEALTQPSDDVTVSGPVGAASDPAVVFYTSGTTSDPKGCLQSHYSLVNHSYQVGEFLGVTTGDIALGALPFCGVMGYNILLSALTHGIPLVVQTHFDPGDSIALIDRFGVSYFSAIGEMYLRILDHDDFGQDAVSSVEKGAVAFVGTADIEAAVDRIEDAVGFPVVQPYGLSEANSQVFMGDSRDPRDRRKRVGGPLIDPKGVSAKLIDPERYEEVEVGEEGELCLRGYCVMNEYLGKPEATDEAFLDGWLRTGDLCVQDQDDYLYYQGRLDDAMRVRGFLVAPSEIEAVISAVPGVGIAQVVGVPHPRHGEVPVAFVKRTDDTVSADTVRETVAGAIADYKVPARVIFVDAFPRTDGPHGRKIQKHVLRDQVSDLFA